METLCKNQFNRLQMVQFEFTRVRTPFVSSTVEELPLPIFSPCCFLPSSFPIIKELFIMGEAG